jgi:hypothetical protein
VIPTMWKTVVLLLCSNIFMAFAWWLMLDSRILRDPALTKRMQPRFASLADDVLKRQAPQGQREFLLSEAPIWPTPSSATKTSSLPSSAQALHNSRRHCHCERPRPVLPPLLRVTPGPPAGIPAVFIRPSTCSG